MSVSLDAQLISIGHLAQDEANCVQGGSLVRMARAHTAGNQFPEIRPVVVKSQPPTPDNWGDIRFVRVSSFPICPLSRDSSTAKCNGGLAGLATDIHTTLGLDRFECSKLNSSFFSLLVELSY